MTKIKSKDFDKLKIKIDEVKLNLDRTKLRLDTLNTKIETNRLNIKKILDWLSLDSWQEEIRKGLDEPKPDQECPICHDSGKLNDGGSIVGCYKCGKDWRTDSKKYEL